MWIKNWCVIPIEQMKIRMRQGGEQRRQKGSLKTSKASFSEAIVVPIKSYTRRRAADSTDSMARQANAVAFFFIHYKNFR